jgi:hypothetical protein
MKARKQIYLSLMAIFILCMQAVSPALVYADGETTPAPDTSLETATAEPTEVPTEGAPIESALPTESLSTATTDATELPTTDAITPTADPAQMSTPVPATDSPEATAEPAEPAPATPDPVATAAPEEPTISEALQELPENTSIVVLDDNGQPLPLALQEAAQVIAQADPLWCPDGVAPGGAGCTTSYGTMADLLTNEGAYINGQIVDGTIWITSGAVGDINPILFDGLTYTNWANYGLHLQGGWSGLSGDTSIGANSVFSVPITVSNWHNVVNIGNVTASSVNISDTDDVTILADVNASTINIHKTTGRVDVYNSTGNLNITNSDINNNGLYSAGVNIHTLTGNLTISNSAFHGNGYDGVWMDSVGNVTISDSLVYQNGNNGLGIYNAGDVTLSNSLFNGNTFGGSVIYTANSVTINNSSADANGGNGTDIYNAGSVTISNLSTFNQNVGNGASIFSSGDINISNSTFNDNLYHGLAVFGATGNVTLANLTATANPGTSGDGAYIDNTSGAGNVTLTGTNNFSNHSPWNSGMYIISNGDVSLSGMTSNNNGRGVNISQARNVTIMNGTFNDNVCNCDGTGAYVFASGNVTIGQSAFNRDSLYISSAGDVAVNHVNVSGAPGVGLGVETQGGDVAIANSRFINSVPDYSLPIFPYGDGADIFPNGGNVMVTDSEFTGNEWGLWVANGNQVVITNNVFDRNTPPTNIIDLAVSCALTAIGLSFPPNVPISITVNPDCTYLPAVTVVNNKNQEVTVTDQSSTVISATNTRAIRFLDTSTSSKLKYRGRAEFWLDCDFKNRYFKVNLPNGDRVDIYCPVSGKATITRLDNTTLPAPLPTGYTFASAFEVQILQPALPLTRGEDGDYKRQPIPVIAGDGRIMASFVATPLQPGKTYSVLYWDEKTSTWIPLKDYLLGSVFELVPGDPRDERQILSGVLLSTKNRPQRVQVITNFPGIFVLAQQ